MKYTFLSVVLTATLAATACSPKTADAEAGAAPMPVPEAAADVTADMAAPAAEQNDVVDLAIGSPDHSTLVSAVQAAGLVDTLKGAGPFTVFAPVNAAFDALPAGTVDTLLKPESKGDLTTVLTYHVVAFRSAVVTLAVLPFASVRVTPPSANCAFSSPPCTVFSVAVPPPASICCVSAAASTLPATTW